MSSMTVLGCNSMIDFIMGQGEDIKSPTILKLALFTNDVENDDPIEVSTEKTGYARQDIVFAKANKGKTYNVNTITFPAAKKSWGVVTSIGVYANIHTNADKEEHSEEVLELIYYASLPTQKEIPVNAVLSFSPGNIRFSLI